MYSVLVSVSVPVALAGCGASRSVLVITESCCLKVEPLLHAAEGPERARTGHVATPRHGTTVSLTTSTRGATTGRSESGPGAGRDGGGCGWYWHRVLRFVPAEGGTGAAGVSD